MLIEHLGAGAREWLAAPHPATTQLTPDAVSRRTGSAVSVPPLLARGDRPEIFVEPVECDGRPVILFGAGHVGRAIAERAHGLPFHIAWYDCRAEAAETPGVMLADPDAMVACAGTAPAGTAILVLTHDHGLDYRLTAAALTGGADFVGLIGSATKRARFLSRLAADSIAADRLTCPIGLPGVIGKEPGAIAVAVLAQLLSLRNQA